MNLLADLFTIPLENQPGQLAKLLTVIGNGGIVIHAVIAIECHTSVLLTLVPDDDERTALVLTNFQYRFDRQMINIADADLLPEDFADWISTVGNMNPDFIVSPLLCVPYNLADTIIGVCVEDQVAEETWRLIRSNFPLENFDPPVIPFYTVQLPVTFKLSDFFKRIDPNVMFRNIELGVCNGYRQIHFIPYREIEDVELFERSLLEWDIEGVSITKKYLLKAISAGFIPGIGGIRAVSDLLSQNNINIEAITLIPGGPANHRIYYSLSPRNRNRS